MLLASTLSLFLLVESGVHVLCAPATLDFLPPYLPEEYSLSFEEINEAYYYDDPTRVFHSAHVFGTQHWSKANLAQRAVMKNPNEEPDGFRMTVSNFTVPTFDQAQLVTHSTQQQCMYYRPSGNIAYQGHEFFRYFTMGAIMAGVPVEQTNQSDWIYGDQSYGPVHIWSGNPPPLHYEEEELTYTVVFPQNSNRLLAFRVNGTTKMIESTSGKPEMVIVNLVNIRTNYTETNKRKWPKNFFNTIDACPPAFDVQVVKEETSATAGASNETALTATNLWSETTSFASESSSASSVRDGSYSTALVAGMIACATACIASAL